MRRVLFATAFVLCAAATAQEPKPAPQPVPAPKVAAQPIQFAPRPATATRLAALEEEVETLEAHRDVKRAYLKAAEVSAKLTERVYELTKKNVATASFTETFKAESDYELAKAQVEVRAAELREVDVKLKHAKKRWEDAKATAKPAAPPAKVVDPLP